MACDDGYAMPLATALRSLAESNKDCWPIEVYLLTDRFDHAFRIRVEQSLPPDSVSMRWIDIDLSQFNDSHTDHYISRTTFARLLVDRQLPANVGRAIYLDGDILVLGSLRELWQTDLQGKCVAAVPDAWIDNALNTRLDHPRLIGVPRVPRYFNAGVILMDLRRWSRDCIGQRSIEYLRSHQGSPYADQDALNAMLADNWLLLPERWNFQHHLSVDVSKLEAKPAIVHFITSAKPWLRQYTNPNEGLFDRYREKTLFSRTIRDKALDLYKTTKRSVRAIVKRQPKPDETRLDLTST